MKRNARALMLCAAIIAINNAYADAESGLGERMNIPYSPSDTPSNQETKKTRYPMIEQYAPETIKEVCQRPSIITCPECQAAERMLWCAKQLGKTLDINKENTELYYYCQQCLTIDSPDQKLIVTIIDAIACKAHLNHDQAFALLKEFNRAVAQAQKDGDQEKAKYLNELTHPN